MAAADHPQCCSVRESLMHDLLSEIWNRYSHKLLQAWPCIFKCIYLAHSPSIETTESFFDFSQYFVRVLLDIDMSEKLLNPLTLFYRKNTSGFMTRKLSFYYLRVFFSPKWVIPPRTGDWHWATSTFLFFFFLVWNYLLHTYRSVWGIWVTFYKKLF